MGSNEDSAALPARIQSSFQKLKAAATELNSASDRFTKLVSEIDTVLRPLNIGIETWVQIGGKWSDFHESGYNQVGYAKQSGKWGICLQTVTVSANRPDGDVEAWSFGDGPRRLRLAAIEYLPGLLEELAKRAADGTRDITEKTADLESFVSALKGGQNK